jgi:GGDEF domain-containing protein
MSSNFAHGAIEFSNNGVLDSLTGAPAPKTFFDNLAREISQSRRRTNPIAIVTIKLLPKDYDIKKIQKITTQQASQRDLDFEKLLVLLSNKIKTNMRGGDFYSRVAENGFWLCLQGDLSQATSTAKRFEEIISEKFITLNVKAHVEFSVSEWNSNLDMNKWIAEIDREYFAS